MNLLNKICKFILNKKATISVGFYLFSLKNLHSSLGRFPHCHLRNEQVFKKLLIFAKHKFGYSVIQLDLNHHSIVNWRNTINTGLFLTETTPAISVNVNFQQQGCFYVVIADVFRRSKWPHLRRSTVLRYAS